MRSTTARRGRAIRAGFLAGALVVGLAACGGDDGDTGDDEAAADVTTTVAESDDDATTTTSAAEPAGGDFCAQVQAVKDLSREVGLGPGSVPGADALQQIRDAQAAIDPPDEIEEVWNQNLAYADEGIAIAREAEANGSTAYEGPYLDRSIEVGMKQVGGAQQLDAFVKDRCGFSVSLVDA